MTSDRLELWRRREPISADKLNRTNRVVNDLLNYAQPSRQVFPDQNRQAVVVQQFRVELVPELLGDAGDLLICRAFDGAESGSIDFVIAKPWDLRVTPFDGETRDGITYTYTTSTSRTADDGSESETQVVVPSYVVGDVILAMSGVKGFPLRVDLSGDGVTRNVDWVDINAAGRAWAKASS